VSRRDGWANELINIGTSADRRISSYYSDSPTPTQAQYEAIYNGDGLAARIVTELPDEALRQGWELATSSDMEAGARQRAEEIIDNRLNVLNAKSVLREGAILGRLFGGGGVVIATADDDWSTAMDRDAPQDMVALHAYDRWEMTPETRYYDKKNPNYGGIQQYKIMPADGLGGAFLCHASRILLFGGADTTRRTRARLNYWDHSILRRVYSELRDQGVAWNSVLNTLVDSSVGVLKIHRLYDQLAGKLKEVVRNRIDVMSLSRNSSRIFPIDTTEDYKNIDRTYAGIADVLDRGMAKIAAITGYPVTKLFGQSPAGLNATGESDTRQWYDVVQEYRDEVFTSPLRTLVRMIALEQGVPDPESWSISWPSLWQESPSERADRRAAIAGTDVQYINSGVLAPDEVAMARYGSGEWSDAAPQIGGDE
jgi:phage-related protein (TIGR01555 family)